MKKLYFLSIVLTSLFVLGGCDQFGVDSTQTTLAITQTESNLQNNVSPLDVNELALQAASVNSLVIPFLSQSDVALVGYQLMDDTSDEPEVSSQVDNLDRYLELLNQLLDNNNGLTVAVDTSDRVEYQFMATYSIVTLLGDAKTYTLYYNEIVASDDTTDDTTTEQPTTEVPTTEAPTETDPISFATASDSLTVLGHHQDSPFQFPCEDNDLETVLVQIQGLLVSGDQETALEGALLSTDREQVLRLYAYVDNDNYVKLSVKTNNDDSTQKFFYQVVQEGIIVSESNIRVTLEENGLSVNLEIVEGTQTVNFKANQETIDGITQIRIRYDMTDGDVVLESGNVIITKTVDELTGEDVYEYTVLPDGFGYGYQYKGDGGHHGCSKGVPFTGEDQQPPFGHKDNGVPSIGHHGDTSETQVPDQGQGHHGGGHHFGMSGDTQPSGDSTCDNPTEEIIPDPNANI